MIKAEYTEVIDQYMEGSLDREGLRKFEHELKVNPKLAMEFRLEQDLDTALGESDIIDFRAMCIEAQEEVKLLHSTGARVIQTVRKYWYAAAAAVLVALIAGSLLIYQSGRYSDQKLFKMYYKSGEIGIKRSGNANMVEALMAYSKKDFVTASQAFEQVLSKDPANIPVQYYCGISNIEIGNYTRAIQLFNKIIKNDNNSYVEYAQWNLGLSYLANNQESDAVKQFKLIAADENHTYRDQAKSILEKINNQHKNKKLFNNLFFLILPF